MLLVTKNIIRRIFADIATAHWQINSFGYGELQELPQLLFDEDTQSMPDRRRYPILFVSPDIDTIQGKTIYYGYKIVIADLVRTGEQNETEVESDTFLIIQDVIAQIQDQDYGFLLDIDNIQIEPFTEKWTDLLTGHIATVRLKTAFQFNRCQIPSSFISISNPYIPLNEEGTNERDPLSWHKTGNTLTASSTLGSNNDQDWRIIHNNVTLVTVTNQGLEVDGVPLRPVQAFSVENVTTEIQDDRLIGGTLDGLFAYQAGVEQGNINNIADYNTITGTITFLDTLGGSTVKILLVL